MGLRALNGRGVQFWDIGLCAFFLFEQFVLLEVSMTTSDNQPQRAEEALLVCAGGVVHDFNNLVTVILGYTDLSLRRCDVDDSIRHNLEETKKAAERAAPLIRQLLALIRQLVAISRQQTLESKVLDLNPPRHPHS
jgi:signal transduction histidine kinase